MRSAKDPQRGNERNYIPNDEIDREEKADIRQQKKGSAFSVLLGGLIVISLIAFIFVLLDSGILSGGAAQTVYGTPQLSQEEKKAAEEEARIAAEEAKQKKKEAEEAARAEEEAARKAEKEESERLAEEEAARKAEEEAEKRAEEKEEKEEEEARKKELEEEQKVLAGDFILAESNIRYYSEEELNSLTDREVLFALNEIYARRGRIFTGEEFKRYFESKDWYKGRIPAEEFDANQNERFNEYEKANINTLVKIAQERGIR